MPLDSKSVSCSVCSADQEVSVIPHADFGTAEVESSNIAQHCGTMSKASDWSRRTSFDRFLQTRIAA